MVEFSLRATHRVRLSQERETWSGGTCVGMRVAFRDDTPATGGNLQHQNLNDQQSQMTFQLIQVDTLAEIDYSNRMQLSFSTAFFQVLARTGCKSREPFHPIKLPKELNSGLRLAHTVDTVAATSCKNLKKRCIGSLSTIV